LNNECRSIFGDVVDSGHEFVWEIHVDRHAKEA
jgi:hypothetical protein